MLMKIKEWLAFILLGLIWGSSFLWIKIAVNEIGPFLLVALRLFFAILSLLLAAFFLRPKWPTDAKTWFYLTLLGLTNNGLPYLLISWGEQYIDSAVAAILNSTTPLFTMVIAHFWLTDDRITRTRLIALMVGFAGVVVLVGRDISTGVQINFWGQLAILLASLSYGFSVTFARKITQTVAPLVRAVVPLIGADAIIWFLTPLIEAPFTLPTLAITWLALIWLGVLGVGVAFLLYFYLLHAVGPTRTTLVTYVFPLVGVILGVIFLNEKLDWNLALGAMLIVGSIVIVNQE
jgi:drug/metabolite transporter (DMT)-like permease